MSRPVIRIDARRDDCPIAAAHGVDQFLLVGGLHVVGAVGANGIQQVVEALHVVRVVEGLAKSVGSLMAIEYRRARRRVGVGDEFCHALCTVLEMGHFGDGACGWMPADSVWLVGKSEFFAVFGEGGLSALRWRRQPSIFFLSSINSL
ncbi:hypothetical protein DJ564_20815 [Pseudomonas sp. 31-12]|nr:hypothetical protein DJ564_20815 [Pseudomonas sp. 31-12]